MKKMICAILALLLVLTGCQASGGKEHHTGEPGKETQAITDSTVPEGSTGGSAVGKLEGNQLPFENAGKVRLSYTGSRSYVLYVTSVEDLPQEGTWDGYDEAYFETKALVIVVETLGSGSVQVDMESIVLNEGTATVSIRRTMEGDAGTSDMATWMLWAEVEQGLDYDWVLANANQLS